MRVSGVAALLGPYFAGINPERALYSYRTAGDYGRRFSGIWIGEKRLGALHGDGFCMAIGWWPRQFVRSAVRQDGEIGCGAAHSFMILMEYQYGGISPGMPVPRPHAHYQARMD